MLSTEETTIQQLVDGRAAWREKTRKRGEDGKEEALLGLTCNGGRVIPSDASGAGEEERRGGGRREGENGGGGKKKKMKELVSTLLGLFLFSDINEHFVSTSIGFKSPGTQDSRGKSPNVKSH